DSDIGEGDVQGCCNIVVISRQVRRHPIPRAFESAEDVQRRPKLACGAPVGHLWEHILGQASTYSAEQFCDRWFQHQAHPFPSSAIQFKPRFSDVVTVAARSAKRRFTLTPSANERDARKE